MRSASPSATGVPVETAAARRPRSRRDRRSDAAGRAHSQGHCRGGAGDAARPEGVGRRRWRRAVWTRRVTADVRLTAERSDGAVAWRLAVAGNAQTAATLLGGLTEDAACAATLSILGAVAALGRKGRARDLSERWRLGDADCARRCPPLSCRTSPPQGGRLAVDAASPISSVADWRAPLKPISPLEGEMSGRTEGGAVERDAPKRRSYRHPPPHRRPLRRVGRPALRPDPRRRPDRLHPRGRTARRRGNPPRPAARAAAASARPAPRPRPSGDAAQAAGFITDAADPRRSIAACPGSPACASGHIPARAIAAEIAASARRTASASTCMSPAAPSAAPSPARRPDAARPCRRRRARPRRFGRSADRSCRKGATPRPRSDGLPRCSRAEKQPGEDAAACAPQARAGAARSDFQAGIVMTGSDYIKDGTAIYERSFAIIRAEADLSRFSPDEAEIADPHDPCLRPGRGGAGISSFRQASSPPPAPRSRPARRSSAMPRWWRMASPARGCRPNNEVICTLRDPRTAELAGRDRQHALGRRDRALGRPARRRAGGDRQRADRAVPSARKDRATAAPKPAAIIGMPVGFVGAAESKDALAEQSLRHAVRHRARPHGRQRHDRRRRQRAGEGRPVSGNGSGRLIGVGTGPGDPELLTLKAVRALARGRRGRAFRQARQQRQCRARSSRRICGPT